MQLVLGHLGADRRQLQHLVAQRLRVVAPKGVAAPAAAGGLEDVRAVGREQRPLLALVPGLTAGAAAGGEPWRSPLDPRRVGRGRPGGVGGVLVEALLEVIDLPLEPLQPLLVLPDEGQDRSLGSGRDLPPEVFRDGRLRLHAADLRRRQDRGKVGP